VWADADGRGYVSKSLLRHRERPRTPSDPEPVPHLEPQP
jgi:hypothetical protein